MMENLSYWEKQTYLGKPDVAIIGGGITGLTTAIFYKKQNPQQDVLVLERGALPSGASTKNAGFACFGSVSELLDDAAAIGWDATVALVERRWRGLQLLRELVGDQKLGLEFSGGYEIFTRDQGDLWKKCRDAIGTTNAHLHTIFGRDVFTINHQKWSFGETTGVIENPVEGCLHPGKMMQSLETLASSLGVRITKGARVSGISKSATGVRLHINDREELETPQLAVCTNGFAAQLLNVEVSAVRNQVLVTSPLDQLPFKGVFHYDRGYYYFRNIGKRILIGGGRHLAGRKEETDQFAVTDQVQTRLEQILQNHIIPQQQYQVDCRWSGILGVGPSREPVVKRLSPSVCCAVRLGGMGVALGTLLGQELAELLEKID